MPTTLQLAPSKFLNLPTALILLQSFISIVHSKRTQNEYFQMLMDCGLVSREKNLQRIVGRFQVGRQQKKSQELIFSEESSSSSYGCSPLGFFSALGVTPVLAAFGRFLFRLAQLTSQQQQQGRQGGIDSESGLEWLISPIIWSWGTQVTLAAQLAQAALLPAPRIESYRGIQPISLDLGVALLAVRGHPYNTYSTF